MGVGYFGAYFTSAAVVSPSGTLFGGLYWVGQYITPSPPVVSQGLTSVPSFLGFTVTPGANRSVNFSGSLLVNIAAGSMAVYYTLDGTAPVPYRESQRYRGSFLLSAAALLRAAFVSGGSVVYASVQFNDLGN